MHHRKPQLQWIGLTENTTRTCFSQTCKWGLTETLTPVSHAQLTNGRITIWLTDRHDQVY